MSLSIPKGKKKTKNQQLSIGILLIIFKIKHITELLF